MTPMEQLQEAITEFLNETGQWPAFEQFCDEHGFDLDELGLSEE